MPLLCGTALAERIERAEAQLIANASEAARRRRADEAGFELGHGMRDLLAPGAEELLAGERLEPGPLSQQEALELLALSEVIARKAAYGRQLTVRSARATGASWTQIGAALGTTKQSAWEAHSRWIDQQASQRSAYGDQSMDSQQAAAARALAGSPDNEAPT